MNSFSSNQDTTKENLSRIIQQQQQALSDQREDMRRLSEKIIELEEELRHAKHTIKSNANTVLTPQFNAISEQEVTSYRRLIRTIAELFTVNNITYWASGGTHIGVVRNSPPGLARWDDDMDISIHARDEINVKHLLTNHPDLEFCNTTILGFVFTQVKLKDWDKQTHRKEHGLDIFPYTWLNTTEAPFEAAYYMGNMVAVNGTVQAWKESRYHPEDIDQIHDCPFWDITIKCAGNPMDYGKAIVEREFGDDVMDHAKMWAHDLGNEFQTINLAEEDMNQHTLYWPAMDRELLDKIEFRLE